MTPAEILRAARAKIEKPENWCKADFAVTKRGAPIGAAEPNACRWCVVGALRAVEPSFDKRFVPLSLLQRIVDECAPHPAFSVEEFNDRSSHAAVMALYDRAIALAEQEAPQ